MYVFQIKFYAFQVKDINSFLVSIKHFYMTVFFGYNRKCSPTFQSIYSVHAVIILQCKILNNNKRFSKNNLAKYTQTFPYVKEETKSKLQNCKCISHYI